MKNKELTLNEYQEKAMSTCMDSCDNFSYMFINLVGEVGELASKVAKSIRKENGYIEKNNFVYAAKFSDEECYAFEKEMMKEAGDCLWQLAGLCYARGWAFEDIAQMNLDKLASRAKRGVIDGCGDNR